MKAILAKKVEMTHIFDENGKQIPVTVLLATENTVTQVKKQDKDGYSAIQIGFGTSKNVKKPQVGHLAKAKVETKSLREVEGEEGKEYKIGDKINIDIFEEGEVVSVQSTSKGKGFAGVIKRHNFSRGPMSHGSRHHRKPGSIGGAYPQHVFKGTKLPGRMGAKKVTTKGLKIVKVIKGDNLLLVKGAVPGPKKGIVVVTKKEIKKGNK